jgi:TolB-like protein
MFTDIVGYTALMQKDESRAINIRNRHREIYNNLTEEYQGRTVQYYGDGTLSIFDSAISAVECAIDMQKSFREKPLIPVRIGLHMGDIVLTEDDIIGEAVNIASRIESLATAGSILVSNKVMEELKNQGQIKTKKLGVYHFKNDSQPRAIFAIHHPALILPKPQQVAGKTIPVKGKKKKGFLNIDISMISGMLGISSKKQVKTYNSIAILPLNDFSSKTVDEKLLAGIHHAMVNELGGISSLRVISRTSTLPYQKTAKPIPQIAQELDVDLIVEASVLEFDKKISIDISLIDAFPQEERIWDKTFSHYVSEAYDLYKDCSKEIAQEIKTSILPQERKKLTITTRIDPKAYKEYLTGWFYWEKLTPKDLDTAQEYFQRAIEIDPRFTKAHAASAFVWGGKAQMAIVSPAEAIPKVYDSMSIVRELGGFDSDTHSFIAAIAFWGEWNWQKGKEHYEKSLELNSNNAVARAYYAHVLMHFHHYKDALREMELALKNDPYNPLIAALASIVYLHSGYIEHSIEWASKCLAVIPHHKVALFAHWMAYFDQKKYPELIQTIRMVLEFDKLSDLLEQNVDESNFEISISELALASIERAKSQFIDPIIIAMYYAMLNDSEKCLEWLETTVKNHGANSPYIFNSRLFNNMFADEPRYKDLAKQMGLPINL